MKNFDEVFRDLLSGKKTTDEFVEDAMKSVVKDRTAELLLDSQRKEIQRLVKVQDLLISELIVRTDKMHQKNAAYWLEFIENRVHDRND